MKRYRKILLGIFMAGMAVWAAVFSGEVYAAKSQAVTESENTISSNNKKISRLEEENKELSAEISEFQNLRSDAADYIASLDKKKEEIEENIQITHTEITESEENIRMLETELADALEEVRRQKESMAFRISLMYEAEHSGYLDLIFSSGNFASVLNNLEYVGKVTDFDRQLLKEFEDAVDKKNSTLAELNSEKELLTAREAALDTELAALNELTAQKEEEIKAYDKKIEEADEDSRENDEAISKLREANRQEENRIARIEEEERRKEEEARKKAAENKKEYIQQTIGDLDMKWPVPSSGRITSTFGSREAPVAGASTNHKGIDIGATEGSEVIASEKGTVVISTYSESAGNYIMISHGGGIYTVYMHLKKRLAAVDDEVESGQLIGYVGSTGYSTGPHLHFGIRIDGEYVDPQLYVSR